jgi:putative ABC transport system permease protein
MALGARPRAVVGMIAAHALRLAVIGTTAGAIAALLLLPVLALPATGLLFSVRATDPATLAVVAGVLIGTAVAATAIPARRASRVDPVIALRAD